MDTNPKLPEVLQTTKAPATTSAEDYPVEIKTKAYDLFLNSAFDLTDIAMELGLSRTVVAAWARKGQWLKRKQEIEEVAHSASDSKFFEFQNQEKLPEAKNQLTLARALEDIVKRVLDVQKTMSDHDLAGNTVALKRLADTLVAAAGISARVVGLGEKPPDVRQDDNAGRPMLILMGPGSNPVVPVMAEPIDVESHEVIGPEDKTTESKEVTTSSEPAPPPSPGPTVPSPQPPSVSPQP